MGDFINKIKEVFHAVKDKYYVEIAYVSIEGNKVPELLDKHYVIYNNDTKETDFTKDPHKATCFDYALGAMIVTKLKEEFLGDSNLQAGLISIGDAHFVNNISSNLKTSMESALSPEEKTKFTLVEQNAKELYDVLSRIEGLISVTPVITFNASSKDPIIEIVVNSIETKARVFELKSDNSQSPFLIQDGSGNTKYKQIPVKIIIKPSKANA